MKKLFAIGLFSFVLSVASQSSAATLLFDLIGTAGSGLRPGNEPGAITGGTGGEIGAGITFDDVTNLLTLNVGWGSSQGFTNLNGTVSGFHIHGPTAANNGSGFTQTASVLFNLTSSSAAVTGWHEYDGPHPSHRSPENRSSQRQILHQPPHHRQWQW
jgi:hypothetical protein